MKENVRVKIKSLILLSVSFFTVLFYQNCSKPVSQMADSSSTAGSLTAQDIVQQKALTVLTTKCSSCHNADAKSAGVDVLSVDEMLANGVVVPGEPSLSLIFTKIQDGTMPPSKSLSQTEVDAIFDWITNGFSANTSVNLPPPTNNALTATYSSIYKNILSTKCLGCHNSNNSGGGISFSSYATTLNTVQKTLPASSALYTSVATRKTMPKGGASLSSSETQAISDWIISGAPNN